MEITNTENKNLFQQLSSLGFDVNESLLELEKDYSPVEEIGMQNVEIIDSAEEAIQQPLANTDSSIGSLLFSPEHEVSATTIKMAAQTMGTTFDLII